MNEKIKVVQEEQEFYFRDTHAPSEIKAIRGEEEEQHLNQIFLSLTEQTAGFYQ